MEYGNVADDVNSERPMDPPYAFGGLQNTNTPANNAFNTVYNQSKSVLPPVVVPPQSTADQVAHDLRVESETIRNKLLQEVQTQARQQNAKDQLQKRIDDRKKVYQTLSTGPIAANEAAEVRENFTSPGLVLKQQESLLTENHFMPTRVLQEEHTRQFKEGFRKWFETERDKEERRERVSGNPSDILRTNNLNSVLPNGSAPSSGAQAANPSGSREGNSIGNQMTDPHESDRLNKPRITYQQIDSTDRDMVLYPNPNDYIISLSRRFNNVKRIKLVSTEIPNTDMIIRSNPSSTMFSSNRMVFQGGQLLNDANNNFYWIDEADGTEPGNYDCIIYDASITPGNYVVNACQCNEVTLSQQIEAEVSQINRYIDGTPHNFQVTIDSRTNLVTVRSIQTTILGVNPIHTTNGTNEFTVTQLSHPFSVGDFVTLSGSLSVGGIPDSVINATHQIIATTANTYTIRVTTIASQTVDGGGGNVTAGQDKPFMLLSSNVDTPFGQILGFPQQDSAQQLATGIEFIDCGPPNLAVDPTLPTMCGMINVRITATNHGLSVGQQILILDTDTVPSINGLQTVTCIINNNVFEIGKKVKVVNNQTVTQNTIMGYVCRSLDTEVTEITAMTVAQQGFIKTAYPHNLTTEITNNTAWLGNLIGGLTETLVDLNGVHIANQIFSPTEFDIAGGIAYTGISGNAFVVKTSSTALNPIVNIIPANNGRFTPLSTASIYTGSQVPSHVIFRNTNTTPNINADVFIDVDTTETCSTGILKIRGDIFWQSWTATTTSNLVSVYLKCGEGASGDMAQMSIYDGTGTGGTLLAQSLSAKLEHDVCFGAYFCVGSVPLIQGQVYTFSVDMITTLQQKCTVCSGSMGYYSGGVSDLGGGISYEFITYLSPDVQEINYYSQTSGKFDLTTEIMSVQGQSANQNYLRSMDQHIRCIQDVTIESNGIWKFSEKHGLTAGDHFLVRLASAPFTTTLPFIEPNLIGLQIVKTVIDAFRLDTYTSITLVNPTYPESTIFKQIEIAVTRDHKPTPIVNIYPRSSGYLCKDIISCDPTRQQCVMCPGDMVIVRGSSGNVEPYNHTDLIETSIATGAYARNVYGCYTIDKIFSGTSKICHDIFDFAVPGEHIDKTAVNSTIVALAASLPATDIVVQSIDGFASGGGLIHINGETLLYTGTSNVQTIIIYPQPAGAITFPLAGIDITVVSVAGFQTPNSSFYLQTNGDPQLVQYTSTVTFLTTTTTAPVIVPLSYSVIPDIDLTTVVGLEPAPNAVYLDTTNGPVMVTYTGIAGLQLTGCAAPYVGIGGGVAAIGSNVYQDRFVGCTSGPASGPSSISGTWYGISQSLFTGVSGGTGTISVGDSVTSGTNLGECVRMITDNGVPGQNGLFNPALILSQADTIIQAETAEPHFLNEAAVVYMTTGAHGCTIVGNIWSEPLLAALNNQLGYITPDPANPNKFQIYSPTASGNIFGNAQIYYHLVCNTEFTPIHDFYACSYDGMLEVPAHELTANANIFIGSVSIVPTVLGGCDSVKLIDENFFSLNSFITPAAADPEPFLTGPTFPPTLVATDLGFNVGINVELEITDTALEVTQKIAQALDNFVAQETLAGVLDPNQSPPGVGLPMFSYIYASFVSPFGVQNQIIQIVNNPIPYTDVQTAYDVNTNFLFLAEGDVINGSQQTSVVVAETGVTLNINPTTTIPYEPGQPARYFVFYSGGWRTGHVGKAYYKMYLYFTVKTSIIQGNVTGIYAGEYVHTDTCNSLQPVDITPANTGVIIAPNDFTGGECLYFLNDVNLNLNTVNPIANNFFTVSSDGLSATQFSLNVPITNIGPITGNNVQNCDTLVYDVPGKYETIATSSQYQVILSGAGGGNGIDYTTGIATPGVGGFGGLVVGTVDVIYGQPFYIVVGGAGENGKFSSQSFGGYNGGGDSGFGISGLGGLGCGAGGGATDVRVGRTLDTVGQASQTGTMVTGTGTAWQSTYVGATIRYANGNKAVILSVNTFAQTMVVNTTFSESLSAYSIYLIGTEVGARIAIAAGGGGGTASYATQFLGYVTGFDGGHGGGVLGNDGAGIAGYFGNGGTAIAGGLSGLNGFDGDLALGGGPINGAGIPVITFFTNLQFIGGGGGYYGGGSGVSSLVNGTNALAALYGAGGGGSSYITTGTLTTAGGSASNTDGFAILRPINIATFTSSTPINSANGQSVVFTIPANATSITIECLGAPGGNAASGLGVGGNGGKTSATFVVGGESILQAGTILNVVVGSQGSPGNLSGPSAGGSGGGAAGSTGAGAGGGSSSVRIYTGLPLTASNINLMLIVAGGGGGGGTSGSTPNLDGGHGGGAIGGDAQGIIGSGGTQTMGGDGGTSGIFLFGGTATSTGLGGGGGGLYGGGSGIVAATPFSGVGGGGGSGYVTPDFSTVVVSSITYETGGGATVGNDGSINITWTTESTVNIPMGHFIQTPCASACDPCGSQFVGLSLIEQKTNGIFCSGPETGFPLGNLSIPGDSTCIFLTNLNYGGFITPQVQDIIANAIPFQTPAPDYSTTKFETNIVITSSDLEVGGFPLFGNDVDPVSASDLRYPGINGLGWILATDCLKNPIVQIIPDSNGTFSPVIPGLMVGDTVYFDSSQPSTPPLTGAHIVSYVDVGNAIPQFFSLSDVIVTDTGGPIESGNIFAFRAPPLVGNASPCFPIGNISNETCPTILQVTNNGYDVGSFVNLYITGTQTNPSINSVEGNTIVRDIIVGATVLPNDLIQLPLTDTSGNSLCNIEVLNSTSLIITPRGQFSTQILSTNCGRAIFQPDISNNLTVVYTPSRCNIYTNISLSIVQNIPHPSGSSTIVTLEPLPANWVSGTIIAICGQTLGNPYISGSYKIFNIGANQFDIISGAVLGSTGGTGGFVTGPAPLTISGHGLKTGDLVQFMPSSPKCQSLTGLIKPNITGRTFAVTVIDDSHFTIPIVIEEVQGEATWCNNLINAYIPNHGLKEGDIFFLYNAGNVGGLVSSQLNTVHGNKIMNVPTSEEIATRKIVHVVDANNIQFTANNGAFPTSRSLGGGYQICISAKNHDLAEIAMGCKNYGFKSLQTNQNCNGSIDHFINFSNLGYILMTSDRLSTDDANPVLNTGPVDHVFAKIQLSSAPGTILYNTYIGGERLFYEPINRIDAIDVQFYRPDNTLFEFMGREHSFTLEIEEYQDRLRTANVASRRGINDVGAVGQIGLVESLISRENPKQNLAGSVSVASVAAATGFAGATGQ